MKIAVKGVIVPNEYKDVYDWLGWDAVSPKDVNDALEKANGQPVDVEINSRGGEISSGSEIYTALRNYKGDVNIQIVGYAASAASVIAMAGTSEMSPTALMMVHKVSSSAEGNHHAMDTESAALQTADKAMAAAYVSKSGMSEADALDMMDKTTWIDAKAAVEKGLVDKVMFEGDPVLTNAYGDSLLPYSLIQKIKSDIIENKKGLDPQEPDNSNEKPKISQNQIDLARAKLNLIEKTM